MFVLTVVFYTRNSRLDDYFTHLDLFVKYSTNLIGLVNNRNKDLYFYGIKSELSSLNVDVINILLIHQRYNPGMIIALNGIYIKTMSEIDV